jgi:Mn2+/Fe2+ NRAMP family transporter
VLVAAILGWMPTGIDVSVWHSFWTLEKIRRSEPGKDPAQAALTVRAGRLRHALVDMRIGYGLSLCTGVMFVIMGAVHLADRGQDLQGVQYAEALSTAYTNILGRWMVHVFMLTALLAMFSTSLSHIDQPDWRVRWPIIVLATGGIVFTILALGTTVYLELFADCGGEPTAVEFGHCQ